MSIEEIRKRREAIDGAPWKYEKPGQTVWGHSRGGCSKELSDYQVANIRGWGHLQYMGIERGDAKAAALQDANGEFIAHAPADIDTLLAEIERLRAIVREIVAIDPLCGGGKGFHGKYFIEGDLIVRAREALQPET